MYTECIFGEEIRKSMLCCRKRPMTCKDKHMTEWMVDEGNGNIHVFSQKKHGDKKVNSPDKVSRVEIYFRHQNGMKCLVLTAVRMTSLLMSVFGVKWHRQIVTENRWLPRERTLNCRCQTCLRDTTSPKRLDM